MRPNIRTATITLTEAYQRGSALLDALVDFDGESRFWRDVEIAAIGGAVRVALTASTSAPASDAASVGIDSADAKVFSLVDFETSWFKAGAFDDGGSEEAGSGSEESGSEEAAVVMIEIVGTPSSYDAAG